MRASIPDLEDVMTTQTLSQTARSERRAALEATVAGIYGAFGRGDVPAILDTLADDVSWDGDWRDNTAQHEPVVAHLAPRRGRAGAGEFFALLGAYTLHSFAVLGLLSGDDEVVARVEIDVSLPSGGRLRDEELHWWRFDAAGRVTALRHYTDTAKHRVAAAGQDTTQPTAQHAGQIN
jgi:ketosteroid isomerase-like protein